MSKDNKTAAALLVQSLAKHGVKRVSTVAGESYLAVLDALLDYPEIGVMTCRQEGGAAFMAESWGKTEGQPGICFVTRGPGACNAAIGVHTAMQDSSPMILFMGQVARKDKGREAFQEIDVTAVFGSLVKWATEIDDPADIPAVIKRAFETALSGRPGPVVIGLPEDMLVETTEISITEGDIFTPAPAPIEKNNLNALKDLLAKSSRPVAFIGGSGWSDKGCRDFMDFANANHLPVASCFRRQDLFHHNNDCYIGELGTGPNPELIKRLREESDLILMMGGRFDEITTQGYTLPDIESPRTGQTLVHIYPDQTELGRLYKTQLDIKAAPDDAAAALAAHIRVDSRPRIGWKNDLRTLYEQWTAIDHQKLHTWNGADMTAVFSFLRDHLPKDSIITTDAGNFSGWAQRYLRYGRPGRLLAPVCGAMGYAVPAAVGAALAYPERTVLGICGDGGFMMNGQELATAMHHGAKPVILLCNNNMYGTIRMHQEITYPGRHSATALTNPDFVALAQSYGAFAARVDHADNFESVWTKARQANKLSLIEIKMDSRQITTNAAP